jgi:hypothetical protein
MNINGIETLIAVDSYSNLKVNCTGGDYYQRVDTQLAFINQYMTAPTTPSGTGGTTGSSGSTGSGSTNGGSANGGTSGGTNSGGNSSSGSSSGGDSSGGDTSSGTGATSPASASAGGCAVGPSHRTSASDVFPWGVAIAFLAMRSRRNKRA